MGSQKGGAQEWAYKWVGLEFTRVGLTRGSVREGGTHKGAGPVLTTNSKWVGLIQPRILECETHTKC